MEKTNKSIRGTAIAWIVISLISIIIRLPIGEDSSFINGQFWTYMAVGVINLIAGIYLLKRGKGLANLSVIIIALTFVATEIASRLAHPGKVTVGQSIASAILPVVLIVLLYSGKAQKKA